MDKQQIAQDILKKYNLNGYVPQSKQPVDITSRFAEIDAIASGQVQPDGEEKRNIAEKILDFTGGKETAQAIGQGMANKQIAQQITTGQNQAIDIQGKLIKNIKEMKALGQDTSRLEDALQEITGNISAQGKQASQLLNQEGITGKQIAGDALQLATTIAGAGTLPGVAKGVTTAQTVGQGVLQGAKAGAMTGAGFGGATGVSQGLQEDKTAGEIVKQGLGGAVGGAVTGGILGGVVGGVSGAIKQKAIKKGQEYLDAITPETKDLTEVEYEKLLARGKITPKTATSPARYVLSEEEKQIASKYKTLLTKDPAQNTINIANEISKKDAQVGKFLEKNNGIFNTGELKNKLTSSMSDITDLTVDERRLEKLKQTTIDNFVKGLQKKDMKSLWEARKLFDSKIEGAFKGSPTLQKEIKIAFRNAVQDFIAEKTPEGVYKGYMKDMSQLFNLKNITETKAVKERGMSAIQTWIKNNPTKSKALAWTAGSGIIGGLGYSALTD